MVLTYALLGGAFTVWRVVFAFSGAILFGYLCLGLNRMGVSTFSFETVDTNPKPTSCCNGGQKSAEQLSKWVLFWRSCWKITKSLGGYFILGMAVASLLTVLIPPNLIPNTVGATGLWAFVLALVIGIPLYVCEGEEIPMTLSLISLGLGPGPAMTFLLGAVGTCIPTVIMSKKLIGLKPVIVYVIYWFLFALVAGLIFQSFA